METAARVFVAGHRGMVGSALVRALRRRGFENLLLKPREVLDLTDPGAVEAFFAVEKPDLVYLAAARVGGILANATRPGEFIRENLAIQNAVIHAAWKNRVRKLLFLGSSCIYPRLAPQPIKEASLMTGPLEPTNQAYAIAKIAGIMMCQAYSRQHGCRFISVMPTNLYGPGDNYDPETSHVVPALIRKFIEARRAGAGEVTLWGTGMPRREFLHVDDLADAGLFLMERYESPEIINIGTGVDLPIHELATKIAGIAGFPGAIRYDSNKPDGPPRKLLDVSKLTALGWTARISLDEGLGRTVRDYEATPG